MATLTPPSSLDDSCSIVVNDTLYVYTPTAFLSLPLHNSTSWSKLPSGAPTSGARCVRGTANGPNSADALWIVGGSSQDASYPGLQRYTFFNQSWTTINPVTKVTQNRRGHAATFLKDSASILVYAGSQDDPNQPSIETFTISTVPPYQVLSYTSTNFPVVSPVLLPWSTNAAISLGGNIANRNITLFQAGKGWSDYPTRLFTALKPISQQRATIVVGDDGSKVLEIFDMSVSPNLVSRIVLQTANGQPAPIGFTVGAASTKSSSASTSNSAGSTAALSKRAPTLGNWPAYNSTNAPTYTRDGFSLAVNNQGIAAIVGGNDQHPIALFDESQNSWLDASKFFGARIDPVQSFLGPTATSAFPSTTPSATSSSTAAPAPPHHSNVALILGATLGSILGAIALLIIILLLLRYRRMQKQREAGYVNEDEKRRLSFADRGDPNMMENPANDKHSSIAIMTGRIGQKHMRGGDGPGGSDSSTARLVPPKKGLLGPHDAMEMETIVERSPHNSGRFSGLMGKSANSNPGGLAPPKRSSGWSRYFSGSEAGVGGLRSSSGSKTPRKSAQSAVSDERASSRYSFGGHDCQSHGPTELPPLNLGTEFESDRLSAAVSRTPRASPTNETFGGGIPRGGFPNTGTRPTTAHSRMSSHAPTVNESLFSEGQPQQSQWTPVTGPSSDWGSHNRDTGISSVYSEIPNAKSPTAQYFSGSDAGGQGPVLYQSSQYVKGANDLPGQQNTAAHMNSPPNVYSDLDHPGTTIPLSGKGTNLDAIAKPRPALANGAKQQLPAPQGQRGLDRPSTANDARPPSPLGLGAPERLRSPSPSSAMLEPNSTSPPSRQNPMIALGPGSLQRPALSHAPASSMQSSQLSGLSAFPTPGTGRPGTGSGRNSPVGRKPVNDRQPTFIAGSGVAESLATPAAARGQAPNFPVNSTTPGSAQAFPRANGFSAAMASRAQAGRLPGSSTTDQQSRTVLAPQFADPRSNVQRSEDSSFFGARGVDRVPVGQKAPQRPHLMPSQSTNSAFGETPASEADQFFDAASTPLAGQPASNLGQQSIAALTPTALQSYNSSQTVLPRNPNAASDFMNDSGPGPITSAAAPRTNPQTLPQASGLNQPAQASPQLGPGVQRSLSAKALFERPLPATQRPTLTSQRSPDRTITPQQPASAMYGSSQTDLQSSSNPPQSTNPFKKPIGGSTAPMDGNAPIAPPTVFGSREAGNSHDSIDSAAFFGGAPESKAVRGMKGEGPQASAGASELPIPKFSNPHDSIDSTSVIGNGLKEFERAGPLGRLQANSMGLQPPIAAGERDSIDTQLILGNGRQENSAQMAQNRAKGSESLQSADRPSQEATVLPAAAQAKAQRASMFSDDDDFLSDDEVPQVVTVKTSRVPTAVTAIPVPASTAMQYTVKKAGKQAGVGDSWPL